MMVEDNLDQYLTACVRTFGVLPLYNEDISDNKGSFSVKVQGEKDISTDMVLNGVFIPELEKTYDISESLCSIYRYCSVTGGKQSVENLFKTMFYDSFETAKNVDAMTAIIMQLTHYITTAYNDYTGADVVYVPNESFNDNDFRLVFDANDINVEDYIKLKIVRVVDEAELNDMCINMLTSGIALEQITIMDIICIMKTIGTFDAYVNAHVDDIKNKEARIIIYDMTGLVPNNPEEFLRYMLYEHLGTSLKIKNLRTFYKIKIKAKCGQGCNIEEDFKTYITKNGYANLASIFYRNKLLFLAFKKFNGMAPIINKLRRLAPKYHKPMKTKILDRITNKDLWTEIGESYCATNDFSSKEFIAFRNELQNELDKVTVFKKIALLNALRLYEAEPENVVYQIRNGSAYVKVVEKGNDINE